MPQVNWTYVILLFLIPSVIYIVSFKHCLTPGSIKLNLNCFHIVLKLYVQEDAKSTCQLVYELIIGRISLLHSQPLECIFGLKNNLSLSSVGFPSDKIVATYFLSIDSQQVLVLQCAVF